MARSARAPPGAGHAAESVFHSRSSTFFHPASTLADRRRDGTFLVYSSQFDVEGLIATTSTWMKNKVRPDVIQMLVAYRWFFYPEAGTGIPGRPVVDGPEVPIGAGGVPGEGGIPSGPAGGPRPPPARVTLTNESTARVTVTPRVAGTAHIILAVEDNGSPTLTSYRRVILTIGAK